MAVTSLARNSVLNPTKYTDFLAGNSQYDVSSMVPIATISNLSAVAAFTNIPQGYQDLMLVFNGRTTRAVTTDDCLIRFNNDGAGINSWTVLNGSGSSATSYRNASGNSFIVAGTVAGASATTGMVSTIICHILSYANTTTYKTMLSRAANDMNGSGTTQLTVGLYRSTAAITRLDVTQYTGYTATSTATLYGIKAVGQ